MTSLLLWSWLVAGAVMVGLWIRQNQTENATSVDVAWSAIIGVAAVVYALVLDGDPWRRGLVALLAAAWSFRLARHLWIDRVTRLVSEDGRYRAMREMWGPSSTWRFFIVYQLQAIVAVFFTVPLLGAMEGGELNTWLALPGVLIWLVSVAGESIADQQLADFRADPANKGKVCSRGLWAWSRHPNYFFEWLHWWSYVLIGEGAALTWIGPIAMFLFVYRFTGIPHTERQAIRTRGEAYRAYQRTTSPFFPHRPHK